MIDAKTVMALREKTGCGMMDCKKALAEADGNEEKAVEILREKGLAKATKKAGRIAAEGIVEVMVEGGVGAMVEVNAETDFVAKNDEFTSFVANVTKQVIRDNPADIDALGALPYIGNDSHSVKDELVEKIAKIGENMTLRRFVRFDGAVVGYSHGAGRIGVLVKFDVADAAAADTDEFKAYGKDIAMQIASMNPPYVAIENVPAEEVEKEKEIQKVQAMNEGKPEAIAEKMVQGRIGKFFKEICLVEQPFVKEQDKSVKQYTDEVAAKLGTAIKIVDFARFEKGEGIEKKEDNFADEVAGMIGK